MHIPLTTYRLLLTNHTWLSGFKSKFTWQDIGIYELSAPEFLKHEKSEGACQNANSDISWYLLLLLKFLSSADQQSRKQEHILGVPLQEVQVPMKRNWLNWSRSSHQNFDTLIRLSINISLYFNKSKLKPALTEAKAVPFHCVLNFRSCVKYAKLMLNALAVI